MQSSRDTNKLMKDRRRWAITLHLSSSNLEQQNQEFHLRFLPYKRYFPPLATIGTSASAGLNPLQVRAEAKRPTAMQTSAAKHDNQHACSKLSCI